MAKDLFLDIYKGMIAEIDGDVSPSHKLNKYKQKEYPPVYNTEYSLSKEGYAPTNINPVYDDEWNPIWETTKGVTRGILGVTSGLFHAGEHLARIAIDFNYRPEYGSSPLNFVPQQTVSDFFGSFANYIDERNRSTKLFGVELTAPDPDLMKGSFMENPSFTRAAVAVANALPSMAMIAATSFTPMGPSLGITLLSTSTAGSTMAEAEEAGASPSTKLLSGIVTGLTEGLLEKYALKYTPFGEEGLHARFKSPINEIVKSDILASKLSSSLSSAIAEGIEEGTQQVIQNLVAKIGYDNTRDLFEGVIESVIGGAGSGGIAGAVFTNSKQNEGNFKKRLMQAGVTEADIDKVFDLVTKEVTRNKSTINRAIQSAISKLTDSELIEAINADVYLKKEMIANATEDGLARDYIDSVTDNNIEQISKDIEYNNRLDTAFSIYQEGGKVFQNKLRQHLATLKKNVIKSLSNIDARYEVISELKDLFIEAEQFITSDIVTDSKKLYPSGTSVTASEEKKDVSQVKFEQDEAGTEFLGYEEQTYDIRLNTYLKERLNDYSYDDLALFYSHLAHGYELLTKESYINAIAAELVVNGKNVGRVGKNIKFGYTDQYGNIWVSPIAIKRFKNSKTIWKNENWKALGIKPADIKKFPLQTLIAKTYFHEKAHQIMIKFLEDYEFNIGLNKPTEITKENAEKINETRMKAISALQDYFHILAELYGLVKSGIYDELIKIDKGILKNTYKSLLDELKGWMLLNNKENNRTDKLAIKQFYEMQKVFAAAFLGNKYNNIFNEELGNEYVDERIIDEILEIAGAPKTDLTKGLAALYWTTRIPYQKEELLAQINEVAIMEQEKLWNDKFENILSKEMPYLYFLDEEKYDLSKLKKHFGDKLKIVNLNEIVLEINKGFKELDKYERRLKIIEQVIQERGGKENPLLMVYGNRAYIVNNSYIGLNEFIKESYKKKRNEEKERLLFEHQQTSLHGTNLTWKELISVLNNGKFQHSTDYAFINKYDNGVQTFLNTLNKLDIGKLTKLIMLGHVHPNMLSYKNRNELIRQLAPFINMVGDKLIGLNDKARAEMLKKLEPQLVDLSSIATNEATKNALSILNGKVSIGEKIFGFFMKKSSKDAGAEILKEITKGDTEEKIYKELFTKLEEQNKVSNKYVEPLKNSEKKQIKDNGGKVKKTPEYVFSEYASKKIEELNKKIDKLSEALKNNANAENSLLNELLQLLKDKYEHIKELLKNTFSKDNFDRAVNEFMRIYEVLKKSANNLMDTWIIWFDNKTPHGIAKDFNDIFKRYNSLLDTEFAKNHLLRKEYKKLYDNFKKKFNLTEAQAGTLIHYYYDMLQYGKINSVEDLFNYKPIVKREIDGKETDVVSEKTVEQLILERHGDKIGQNILKSLKTSYEYVLASSHIINSKEFKELIDFTNTELSNAWHLVNQYVYGGKFNRVKNYFPKFMVSVVEGNTDQFINNDYTGGIGSSRYKHRAFKTLAEAAAFGYVIRHLNPVNAFSVYLNEISNSVANAFLVNSLTNDLVTKGIFKVVPKEHSKIPNIFKDTYREIEVPMIKKMFIKKKDGDVDSIRVYTYPLIAKKLNTAFKETISKDIPGMQSVLKWNAVLKEVLLLYSFFHPVATSISYVYGTHGKTKAGASINPVTAYKQGLNMFYKQHDVLWLGIENGLTMGMIADYKETLERNDKAYYNLLKENNFTDKEKGFVEKFRDVKRGYEEWLFKEYIPGLKAMSFIILFKQYKANPKYKNYSDNEIAEKVALRVNDDFGGLHRKRLGWSKTSVDIMRLLFLGHDWTLSNVRLMLATFSKDKLRADLARSFWISALWKGMLVTFLLNATLAFFPNDDDDDQEYVYRLINNYIDAWNAGHLNIFKANATPLAHLFGVELNKGERYYFNPVGYLIDPFKWLTRDIKKGDTITGAAAQLANPYRLASGLTKSFYYKSSMLMKPIYDFVKGTDYTFYRRFTTVDEFFDKDRMNNKEGEEAEVTWLDWGEKPHMVRPNQLMSYFFYEMDNIAPIPFTGLLNFFRGQEDGLKTTFELAGLDLAKGRISKKAKYKHIGNKEE